MFSFEEILNSSKNNLEYEKTSEKAMIAGNSNLSRILMIINFFLLFHLLQLYMFEVSNNHLSILFKMIILCIFSIILSSLNLGIFFLLNHRQKLYFLLQLKNYLKERIDGTHSCIATTSLLTIPFQILYLVSKIYSNTDAIFLFLALESILRYYLIIKYYYAKAALNIISALIVVSIHLLLFNGSLTVLYSAIFLFIGYFSYINQKLMKYELLNTYFPMKETTVLKEVIKNIQYGYIITDKKCITYKNDCFDSIFCDLKNKIFKKTPILIENQDGN